MTHTNHPQPPGSGSGAEPAYDHRRARRAGFAAFVGTTVEWYDFYIYATAAAIVFPQLFFPTDNRWVSIAAAFGTYAVGFFVRPLGGIIFGHIGDRLGRRPSLVLTLLLMGVATFSIGLLPTYTAIGVAAPILLVLLRALQGLAVGGEWGGAVLMAVESAPPKYKTFYGGFPQLGNPAGALLATLIFSAITAQGQEFLTGWGWRIPFLVSVILIGVGFWVRQRVEETPVFADKIAEVESAHRNLPVKDAIVNNWQGMLLAIGLLPIATGGYYLASTFAQAYGTDPSVGVSETLILNAMSLAAFLELISSLPFAWLGDKIGRKKVYACGVVISAVLFAPQFIALGSGSVVAIFLTFGAVRLFMTATYSPAAAILSQIFPAKARYTSIALAYGVGAAVWGGLAPVVASWIFGSTGSFVGVVVMFCVMAVLSLICLALAPQREDELSTPAPAAH